MLAREFRTIRGRKFFPAQIHQALRKLIYTGDFEFDGIVYNGSYTALVSLKTWERVQAILDGRTANKHHSWKRQFTLSGLVRCGHCGCLMVGELKKGRYTYYHCTEGRGRCNDPYVREERLVGELARTLRELVIELSTMSWLEVAVVESDKTEAGARQQALERRINIDLNAALCCQF